MMYGIDKACFSACICGRIELCLFHEALYDALWKSFECCLEHTLVNCYVLF